VTSFYITQYTFYIMTIAIFIFVSFFPKMVAFINKSNLLTRTTIVATIIIATTMTCAASSNNVKQGSLVYTTDTRDWIDAQEWAKASTPKNTTFLTPVDTYNSFRVFSERSVVFGVSDKSMVLFGYQYSMDIAQRTNDFANYNQLNQSQLVNLASKYNAEYIVIRTTTTLNLTAVYANTHYVIYQM